MTDSESSAVEGSETTLVSVTSSLTAHFVVLIVVKENYSISEKLKG